MGTERDVAERGTAPTVFLAIELSKAGWVVALHTPAGARVSMHRLPAGDAKALLAFAEKARAAAADATGSAEVAVASCYEAGYDGFWLHRALLDRLGRANAIDWSRCSIDSASFPAKKGASSPAPTRPTAASPAPSATSSWTRTASRSRSCSAPRTCTTAGSSSRCSTPCRRPASAPGGPASARPSCTRTRSYAGGLWRPDPIQDGRTYPGSGGSEHGYRT